VPQNLFRGKPIAGGFHLQEEIVSVDAYDHVRHSSLAIDPLNKLHRATRIFEAKLNLGLHPVGLIEHGMIIA